MSPDFLAVFESAQKQLTIGLRTSFYLRNIALKISQLDCSSLLRNNVGKKLSSPSTSFGDLLQSLRNFVLLNNEVIKPLHLLLALRTDTGKNVIIPSIAELKCTNVCLILIYRNQFKCSQIRIGHEYFHKNDDLNIIIDINPLNMGSQFVQPIKLPTVLIWYHCIE